MPSFSSCLFHSQRSFVPCSSSCHYLWRKCGMKEYGVTLWRKWSGRNVCKGDGGQVRWVTGAVLLLGCGCCISFIHPLPLYLIDWSTLNEKAKISFWLVRQTIRIFGSGLFATLAPSPSSPWRALFFFVLHVCAHSPTPLSLCFFCSCFEKGLYLNSLFFIVRSLYGNMD